MSYRSTWLETTIKQKEKELEGLYWMQNSLNGDQGNKGKGKGQAAAQSSTATPRKSPSLRSLLGLPP